MVNGSFWGREIGVRLSSFWALMLQLLYYVCLAAPLCLVFSSRVSPVRLRRVALFGSLSTFFVSLVMGLPLLESGFFLTPAYFWFGSHVLFGLDGVSYLFVLLSSLLTVICILVSWATVTYLVYEFLLCLLVLQLLLVFLFTTWDLLIFYVFFEALLIPMVLIIGVWGLRYEKVRAAYYFFFYTFSGSVCFLLSVLSLRSFTGTTDYLVLSCLSLPLSFEYVWFIGLFLGLAVKIPLFPFHIWLPQAHVEAPTAGSVMLAGILLKVGGYGLLRFSWPLFPMASEFFTPLVMVLSVLSMVYAGLVTCRQVDLKRIIAYSSVSHMGLVTASLFSHTITGLHAATFLMLAHGLTSSTLFILVGFLYSRYGSRLVTNFRGLALTMPLFSSLFLLSLLANCSLPATANFIGEFLSLYCVFGYSYSVGGFSLFGAFLSAVYSINLFNRVCFGTPSAYLVFGRDLSRLELLAILPLVFLNFFLGIFPWVSLDFLSFGNWSLFGLSAGLWCRILGVRVSPFILWAQRFLLFTLLLGRLL